MHEFVYARGTRELLHVRWDGNEYWLESASGYRRKSTITDTEDVSYVSSAYVPQCLRYVFTCVCLCVRVCESMHVSAMLNCSLHKCVRTCGACVGACVYVCAYVFV